MKFRNLAVAASIAMMTAALPAQAQDTDLGKLGVTKGATVYGPEGNVAGTVEDVAGGNVVLDTGTYSAALPGSAFGKSEQGPTVTMTKQQIDAAMAAVQQKAEAALAVALVPGAELRTSDGIQIGVVESINEEGLVTVEREAGPFAMKKDMFGTDANGLILRMTAQQLAQALGTNTDG